MATVGESLHESARPAHPPSVPKWVNVAGWICTILPSLLFMGSGVAKLIRPKGMDEQFATLGISTDLMTPLGIFEIVCVVLYLAPATSVLAAILLTGYLGGAILTHLRVHESYVNQMVFGVLVWLGVFFRDYRVRQLIPIRRGRPQP